MQSTLSGRVQTLVRRWVDRSVDGRMSNGQLTAEIERLALNRSPQRATGCATVVARKADRRAQAA